MAESTCRVCGHCFDDAVVAACPLCGTGAAAARSLHPGLAGLEAPRPRGIAAESQLAALEPAAPVAALRPQAFVAGTVIQTSGPTSGPVRRDWWKIGSVVLLFTGLLPFLLVVSLSLWAIRMTFALVGLRLGGGRSLFDEILVFHILSSLFRRPDPTPLYDHVVDTGQGLVAARQEGEFREGRVFVGNRVRFAGHDRGGALHIEEGFNETVEVRLSFRRSPWRPVFFLLLIMAGAWLLVLAAVAGGVGGY